MNRGKLPLGVGGPGPGGPNPLSPMQQQLQQQVNNPSAFLPPGLSTAQQQQQQQQQTGPRDLMSARLAMLAAAQQQPQPQDAPEAGPAPFDEFPPLSHSAHSPLPPHLAAAQSASLQQRTWAQMQQQQQQQQQQPTGAPNATANPLLDRAFVNASNAAAMAAAAAASAGGKPQLPSVSPSFAAARSGNSAAASVPGGGVIGSGKPAQPHMGVDSSLPSPSMGAIVDPSQPSADANAPPMSNSDKFGLFGLLNIIRNTDPDANALALGTDLTTLGLNLNSADVLYATFISPFAETQLALSPATGQPLEPEYHLPACYSVQLPPTAAGAKGIAAKLASFSDETLFYLFYAQPRDAAQELAAQELWSRHWRFNRAAQVWLTKDLTVDPVAKTAQYERGTFVVFDVATWQKTRKELTLYYEQLEERAGNPPIPVHVPGPPAPHIPGVPPMPLGGVGVGGPPGVGVAPSAVGSALPPGLRDQQAAAMHLAAITGQQQQQQHSGAGMQYRGGADPQLLARLQQAAAGAGSMNGMR